jgi:hypothetical protein
MVSLVSKFVEGFVDGLKNLARPVEPVSVPAGEFFRYPVVFELRSQTVCRAVLNV